MGFQFNVTVLAAGFLFLSAALSFSDDRIWMKGATINGEPVKMVFDSDSDGIFLTSDAVKRLGLKVVDPRTTNGFSGYTAVYPVDLGGGPFKTYFGILTVPEYAECDFDALLGWWTLHSSIFRLDGGSRQVEFLWHVPRQTKKWTKFLVMTNSGVLDLEVSHSDGTKGIITVDTGAGYGIGLSPRLWRQWKDAHPHSPMTVETC